MNLCTNCKHFRSLYYGVFIPEVPACGVEGMIDVVDGEKQYRRCKWMRSANGKCGPDGTLFEAKPPTPSHP